jgi:AcrR family transcriptional regulator
VSSRARIDAAALKLFAELGYEGVSLQQVADEVGLHKSTLFHHYKNKPQLFHAVVEQVMRRLVERIRPRLGGPELDLEDFLGLAEDVVDELGQQPEAARLLMHVMLASRQSPMAIDTTDGKHPLVELITRLVDWLRRAEAAGVIRPVKIRFVLFDVMGILLFHPAAADHLRVVAGSKPFTPKQRAARKEEVVALLRGALAP